MQKYTNAVPKTWGEHKTVAEHLLLSISIITLINLIVKIILRH